MSCTKNFFSNCKIYFWYFRRQVVLRGLEQIKGLAEDHKAQYKKVLISKMMSSDEKHFDDDEKWYFKTKKPTWWTKKSKNW